MFSHVMVGSADLHRAKRFYDALFAVMGGPEGEFDFAGRLVYAHKGARFMVTRPIDGEPAEPANGGTIGFLLESADQVQAWHATGVATGGASIEEPPGLRERPTGPIHLAYLRDPDGNKLCAVWRVPKPA